MHQKGSDLTYTELRQQYVNFLYCAWKGKRSVSMQIDLVPKQAPSSMQNEGMYEACSPIQAQRVTLKQRVLYQQKLSWANIKQASVGTELQEKVGYAVL